MLSHSLPLEELVRLGLAETELAETELAETAVDRSRRVPESASDLASFFDELRLTFVLNLESRPEGARTG